MPFLRRFGLRETGKNRADFRSQERYLPTDTADDVTPRLVRVSAAALTRKFLELGQLVGDLEPRRLRSDKDVCAGPHAGIVVERTHI